MVNCHNTGDKAVVSWVAYSKAKERYRELNGQVFNSEGEVQYLLHGAWDKGMVRKNPGESPSGVCVCVCVIVSTRKLIIPIIIYIILAHRMHF